MTTYMDKKRLNIIRFCFCVCQIFNVIGYITNSYKLESLFAFISRSYILLIVIPFILFVISSEKLAPEFFFLILMGLSATLAFLLHSDNISLYSFVLTLSAYLALPMLFMYLDSVPFDRTLYSVIRVSAIATGVFFCFRFFTDPQYSEGGDLTLGYFNANYLSILLIQNISLLIVLKGFSSKKPVCLLYWAMILFEGYMITETHSRASLICVIVLIFLSFRKKKYISKGFTNLAIFIPLIFIFLLTFLAANGALTDVKIFDKPLLSGRERMFDNAINVILANYPIFGYFASYSLGNAHNAFLSVLTSTGIFGFFFFFFFYYRSVHLYRKKLNGDPIRYLAFLGILLLFLEGCAESPLFTGGSMYAAATSPLLLFLNFDESAMEITESEKKP